MTTQSTADSAPATDETSTTPLARRRLAAGLNQTTLAIRSGVHPSTLNRIEQGVRPNRATVRKLAQALNCQPEDLFEDFAVLRRY